LRDVTDYRQIVKAKGETDETFEMKILLCKLGKKLGFEVDVEEGQESELGKLGIRHDILWYNKPSEWVSKLFKTILSRDDLHTEYRKLIERKVNLKRQLYVAFEIEGTDVTTKAMKGDISNLSKLPYGFIVVRRGRKEAIKDRTIEPIRNRFEKALIEFRSLHGPNNVVIVSFEDVKKLTEELGIQ
jgi:hypothetical protein